MSYQTFVTIVLSFTTGYWVCRVRDFVTWYRGKTRRSIEQ